jgi:hypothetical protein
MISVCISTNLNWCERNTFGLLEKCIASTAQIPGREVIIATDIKELPFKNDARIIYCPGEKLGKKNNLLIEAAEFDKVVYMRDYMILAPGWFEGFEIFGYDWDLAMNRIVNPDHSRYRDWVQFCNADNPPAYVQKDVPWPQGILRNGKPYLTSYEDTRTDTMYISGAYFLGKKEFLLRYPFNNELDFCQSEDIEWFDSFRYTDFRYVMNQDSVTQLQIYKDPIFRYKEANL